MHDSSSPQGGGAFPARVSPVAATFAGWLVVALYHVFDIASLPARRGSVGPRLAHHAIDLGHVLAVAFVAAAGVHYWGRFATRFARRRLASSLAVGSTSALLGAFLLAGDLEGALDRLLPEWSSTALLVVLCMAVSQAVTVCFVAGRLLARPRLRWVSIACGIALVAANGFVLENGYPAAHVLLSASGATLVAAALEGAPWPRREGLGRLARFGRSLGRVPRSVTTGLTVTVACLSALSVVRPPPNSVQIELFERDTPLLVPWLRALYPTPEIRGVAIPHELRPHFESRSKRGERPPPSERLLGEAPIVVMITIDALRPDVLMPKRRRWAPALHEMREKSVYFSQARSTASDTRYSMATLFSGLHHSMLRWTKNRGGKNTLERDRTPRLPEILSQAGVQTACVRTVTMMDPRQGIVRGFAEDLRLEKPTEGDRSRSAQVAQKIIERLRRQGPDPLFVYTHLMDPHDPYETYGKPARSKFDAYLMEVALADENLGRIRKAIEELGLGRRTALIIGSDHGEAFGEHRLFTHGKAFYDVMVHVPMMIELPNASPRTVKDFVSLMDLAPTVLDLFGIPTPGAWMAESLTPFLTGGRGDPNRLILMEEFSQTAMLFPDGLKVMKRRGALELYDVLRDPKEDHNLWDERGDEGPRRLELLEAYVRAHARKRSGREAPP